MTQSSFVCVTSAQPRSHFRFRSYESDQLPYEDVAIWEACRATSAAPTFFPPIAIGNPPTLYVDGGLGYNNPIRELLDEVKDLWPTRPTACIVSLGTGLPSLKDVGTSMALFNTIKDIVTDTEQVAEEGPEGNGSSMRYGPCLLSFQCSTWTRRGEVGGMERDGQDQDSHCKLSSTGAANP